MEERLLYSFDGTRLVYQVGGEGDRWIVVANGYGGTFCAWTEVFERLAPRYRLLTWDYRGLHRSGIPDDRSRLTIYDHCLDLQRICAAEGIERMVLAGWSVGVQVALEQYRSFRDTVDALILINGSHERVLHHSLDGRIAALLLPLYVRALREAAPLLSPLLLPLLRWAAERPSTLAWMSRAGMITGEPASLQEALQAVLTLDYQVYAEMGLLADEHETEALLPTIDVPTLVTAGDRDMITPPRVPRRVASTIPGARYREIHSGTHYAVMEFPALFASYIDEFVSELPETGRGPEAAGHGSATG